MCPQTPKKLMRKGPPPKTRSVFLTQKAHLPLTDLRWLTANGPNQGTKRSKGRFALFQRQPSPFPKPSKFPIQPEKWLLGYSLASIYSKVPLSHFLSGSVRKSNLVVYHKNGGHGIVVLPSAYHVRGIKHGASKGLQEKWVCVCVCLLLCATVVVC